MHKSDKKAQTEIVNAMVDLYLERGAMTDTDLIRAGFSQEQVTTCSPLAAARIRETEAIAA